MATVRQWSASYIAAAWRDVAGVIVGVSVCAEVIAAAGPGGLPAGGRAARR
jgi:hypothetical protein